MDPKDTSQSPPPNAPPPQKKGSVLKTIFLLLLVLIGVLLGVVAMQPADFRVERSATIAAPPAEVFAHVNDLHAWQDWSPWAKLDPDAKNTFEGAESGKGAVFKWSGNNEVGEGIMTITDSQPSELVRINLEFVRPFAGTNTAEFTFKPEGDDNTKVTWAIHGKNTFITKAVHLVMDMESMLGGDFEKGLAQLKSVVEKPKEP